MGLLKPQEAAKELGVSYPTIKQWIYHGKIRSIRTAGGHHRIPQSEVDRLLGRADRKKSRTTGGPEGLASISGRNKLRGVVTAIRQEGLLAEVTIDIGGQFVTAIITRRSSSDLGLRKGSAAYALVKATEVMVVKG